MSSLKSMMLSLKNEHLKLHLGKVASVLAAVFSGELLQHKHNSKWFPGSLSECSQEVTARRFHSSLLETNILPGAYPRSEMNITTPINWVNSSKGVKNDHTFHRARLKLKETKANSWQRQLGRHKCSEWEPRLLENGHPGRSLDPVARSDRKEISACADRSFKVTWGDMDLPTLAWGLDQTQMAAACFILPGVIMEKGKTALKTAWKSNAVHDAIKPSLQKHQYSCHQVK